MPWAEFPEIVHFGEVQIWDFYRAGPSLVPDSQEMLWLAQYISSFKNRFGKEMSNVCVIQNGKIPFEPQDGEANKKIRWAGHAINFAYLIGSIISNIKNKNSLPIQSDRFLLVDGVIDYEGFVHYSTEKRAGMFNLKDKHINYNEPPSLTTKINAPDRLLLKGLAKVNEEEQNKDLWRQLSICFEWFFAVWTSSPDVSIPARFISLMTCFESLSKKSVYEKIPRLVDFASELCKWSDLPKTEKHMISSKLTEINKPSKFIFDFADYRNAFVHGGQLPWGLIKYKVADLELDPRHVMSMVIYCMVANLLLAKKIWNELETKLIQQELTNITKLFKWNSTEPLQPSPHLSYEQI